MAGTVIFRPMGGLGNQLFQFAVAYSLAANKEARLCVNNYGIEQLARGKRPGRRASYLLEPLHDLTGIRTVRGWIHRVVGYHGSSRVSTMLSSALARASTRFNFSHQVLIESKNPELDMNRLRNSTSETTSLVGNWQHSDFFSSKESEILKILSNPILLQLIGRPLLDRVSVAGSVGVHVRLGDFVGSKKMKNLTADFYYSAIRALPSFDKTESVIVFSDEPEKARLLLGKEDKIRFSFVEESEASSPLGHLLALSLCQNLVISNSTFSWWAAKLATSRGATVVAPSKWYRDGRRFEVDKMPEWTLVDLVND